MPLNLTPQQPPYYELTTALGGRKIYTAILSQSGTGAVGNYTMQNTIQNTDPTWTREDVGHYKVTFTDDLPTLNWIVTLGPSYNDTYNLAVIQVATNALEIRQAISTSGAGVDGLNSHFTIELFNQ